MFALAFAHHYVWSALAHGHLLLLHPMGLLHLTGPKYGFETVDNGYLRLAHVRVPRDHMLARYAEVTPDGRYVRRGNEKLV